MFKKRLCSSMLAFLVASCGGSDTADPGFGALPVANERLGGIWQGTSTAPGYVQTITGVTVDDGRFRFVALSAGGQFVGTMSVSNQNEVSGSGFGVAPTGFMWADGSTVTSLSMSGTVAEKTSFDGTWSTGTGDSGSINLAYIGIYDRESSLAKVQGMYTGFDENSNPSGSYSIDSGGGISGQDNDGCVYGGRVSIIDASFNVYEVTLIVSNCGPLDGTYLGFGILRDAIDIDDELLLSVDNNNVFIVLSVRK